MRGEIVVLNKEQKFLVIKTLTGKRPIGHFSQVKKCSEPLDVADWVEFDPLLTKDGRWLAMNICRI